MFVDYPTALRWLYGTQLTGIKLGLDPMRRLLGMTGWKPGNARFLHVAGTNGKGSVCALLDAVLRASGRRTGLFTSPHLLCFRERIRLDGAMIPEADVTAGLGRLRALTGEWAQPPTFFELTTALALGWFRERGAEVVVLETGLGGRLDATNVLQSPAACVLTSIGMDHTGYLGTTLTAIAGEKAGILKAGVPAISGPQVPEVTRVFGQRAVEVGAASLRFITDPVPEGWRVGLAGSHQRQNAALALAALGAAGLEVSAADARRGLATVEWPGRFQRFEEEDGPTVVLDGGHNPAAAERLAQTWREEFGGERATIVLGLLRDKDAAGVIRALAPVAGRFVTVTVRTSPRTIPAAELEGTLTDVCPGVPAETAANLADALSRARAGAGGRILVTGSLFLVGEALARLTGVPAPEASWQ